MKSADLTREQTDKLLAHVEPTLAYLARLSKRLDKCGMGSEPLAADVRKAKDAVQALRMSLHYLNCDGLGERANRR